MKERLFYPCLVHGPDADGWFSVVVPGPNVNAQGKTEEAALIEAAEILQELIDAQEADIAPAGIDEWREEGDRPGIIQVTRQAVPA